MLKLTQVRIESGDSPFDSIRRTRPDNSEYWSARDLMPLMGYVRWEDFQTAIERAKTAAKNSGYFVAEVFRPTPENPSELGGRPRLDYEMTRPAAYLTSLNGDPRKPETALAQSYFVQRTREAETAPAIAVPTSLPDALRLAADLAEQKDAAEARVLELEAPAAHAEVFRHANGTRLVRGVAADFKIHAKTNFPGVKILNEDVHDHAGRLGIVNRGYTASRNEPTTRAINAEWAVPNRVTFETKTRGTQTKVTAHLTPLGEARLWDGLCAYIREHGTLALPSKEIAA